MKKESKRALGDKAKVLAKNIETELEKNKSEIAQDLKDMKLSMSEHIENIEARQVEDKDSLENLIKKLNKS